MKIVYQKAAAKAMRCLNAKMRLQIAQAVSGLAEKPPAGDIKPLYGIQGKFRLRLGKYRIIFHYQENEGAGILYIEDIGTRGDIYK